ncbi:multidrug SMR transporter [Sphingobium jiangsuense]|mgnify:CR=1 FL=1|jgi:small multidrug resistance pump|uniref:Small multidrug resistance pump n=5 Tax=Sphingomonadaceae TaxID=41297 RepID=A0A7W6BQK1_9SPHN|nr:small multidrug resistance pump [Sphingobium jiangsuense]GLT00482.1 multidrug SMR transporter [Sphingobium jiangsuense]
MTSALVAKLPDSTPHDRRQMKAYLLLALAIGAEVIATSALKASDGFSRPVWALVSILGYIVAFSALAMSLKTIPLGIAYAIWSGVGIALLTLIGWIVYQQRLSLTAMFGISLIIAGVLVLQLSIKRT